MNKTSISQEFANRFTEVAQLAEEGSAKNKLLRQAKRLQIQAQNPGLDWHEILLEEDLEPSAFDSPAFYQVLNKLSVLDQKRILHGNKFLNAFDGIDAVIIGEFARAAFSPESPLSLPNQISYVMPFKFNRFVQFVKSPENLTKGINVVLAPDGHSFKIESLGCIVIDGKSSPGMEDVMNTATYQRLFNNKVLVSPNEQLWDIK